MFENKMEKSLFASLLQAKRARLRMFTLNKNHHFWRQNSKIQNWKTKELLKIKNENETYFSYFQTQCYISGKIRKCMKRSNWHFEIDVIFYFYGQADNWVQTSSGFRYSLTNRSITFSKLELIKPSQTSWRFPAMEQIPSKVSSICSSKKQIFSNTL